MDKIDNGSIEPIFMGYNKGYRQVVFSPIGEIRPVVECVRKCAVQSEGKTSQGYMGGDYMIRHSFDVSFHNGDIQTSNQWSFLIIDRIDDSIRPMTKTEVKIAEPAIRIIIRLLKDWLSDMKTLTSKLPQGAGWDGQATEVEAKHLDRCLDFLRLGSLNLSQYSLERLIRDILETPDQMHHMVWKEAKKLPYYIAIGSRQREGGSYNEWILIYEDGRSQYMRPTVDLEGNATNYENISMPSGVKKAISITRNILKYPGRGGHYGISWTLFERKDYKVREYHDVDDVE